MPAAAQYRRLKFNSYKADRAKKDGWRQAVFTPQLVQSFSEKYTGEWNQDRRLGKGASHNREGWLYEGDWFNDRRHGYGVLSRLCKNGQFRKYYAGYWKDGKRHGTGSSWYQDGSYYEGSFSSNLREGYGRMWYADSRYYQGTWKANLFDGWGLFVQANGNRYQGQFSVGEREGRGTYYLLNTGQIHHGIWKNDRCITGVIQDTYWRQSAPHPTQYPIPKICRPYCERDTNPTYHFDHPGLYCASPEEYSLSSVHPSSSLQAPVFFY